MPGTQWFPGAHVNYAEHAAAIRAAERHGAPASVRAAEDHPDVVGRARRQGAHPRHAVPQARDQAGRSRRRVPAEHSRSDDRDARDDEHRRHLVELRARLRHARRAGSFRAAHAEDLAVRRWLSVRRQAVQPARGDGADHRRAADARARDLSAVSRIATIATLPSQNALLWDDRCSIIRRCRRASSSTSRSSSTRRCGSCSRAAPPACRRRSRTVTAASSSSRSRPCI